MLTSGLPIDAALPALCDALATRDAVVLQAPPGAGKSTVVPLALPAEPWARGLRILMLEPRRLAARAVARPAWRRRCGEPVGETVGYRMRLETRVGPRDAHRGGHRGRASRACCSRIRRWRASRR